MNNYELNRSALEAALTHVAIRDVRYYLNGVYLDFPNGRIVGSDGHRMFIGDIPKDPEPAVIVDRDTVADAIKAGKRAKMPGLYVNVDPDPNGGKLRRVEFVTAGARFSATEIDGKFPDYARIIPPDGGEDSGKLGQFNPDYIRSAWEGLALYAGYDTKRGRRFPYFEHRGPNNSGVMAYHGVPAISIIMPVRDDSDSPPSRAWLFDTTSKEPTV